MAQYSELKITYDLIIVGAGTAGCSAAITAAQKGLDVCLVDSKGWEDIGDKVCGDLMGESIIRFIKDNLNLDYSDIITNELSHMDIYSPDGTVISMPSDGVMIDRHKFGQALLKDALAAGCDLYSSCVCTEPVIEDNFVRGVEIYDKAAKESYVISSKIVVDASGAAGILRKKACDNKSFDSSFIERDIKPKDMSCSYRQIIELKNPLNKAKTGKMILLSELGGYYWVFPENENKVNVGIGVACNHEEKNLKKRLESIMAEDEIFNGSEIIEGGGGVVPTRRSLYSPVANGIICIGDAAFQINPLTGGGIGPSIGAGYTCAITAAEAIKNNDVSQEGLWGYNTWYHDPNNELRSTYGADLFDGGIQAGRDVIRVFVQSLTDNDINWAFKNDIDNPQTFSGILSANSELKLNDKAGLFIHSLKKPFLRKIGKVIPLMKEMNKAYENYPQTPDLFPAWKNEVDSIYAKVYNICG